jgi:hypothetical protein
VIVYRTQEQTVGASAAVLALRHHVVRLTSFGEVPLDAVIEQLIDAGELASAIIDALHPDCDDDDPQIEPWLDLVTWLASAADATTRADRHHAQAALEYAASCAAACTTRRWPRVVKRRVSEGFAYYALGPELYTEAARRWYEASAATPVVCIGLRTIGLTLACAVSAALRTMGIDAPVTTVRPRGHPFDRRIVMTSRMSQALARHRNATFLVIDEGPGISGSSLASVAEALSRIGITDERVVLMPGHEVNPESFSNSAVRARWMRHRVVVPDFDAVWIHSGRLSQLWGGSVFQDIGAGKWRALDSSRSHVAVHPQHERRKYLTRDRGPRQWIKFAGLGRYGERARRRADQAAAAGWGPPVQALKYGWLGLPALAGRCADARLVDEATLYRLAQYLAFVRGTWATGESAAPHAFLEMGVTNIRTLCGDSAALRFERLTPLAAAEAIRVDGRHSPHEWVQTERGLVKTDGVDHHDDHFFPGPVDIAWDVAGVIEEWQLADEGVRTVCDHYQAITHDRSLGVRLPFYRAAYLAFRVGYTTLASTQLSGTRDGVNFRRALDRYRSRLREAVHVA